VAGIDSGHVDTKAVVMSGGKVLGYASAPTRLDPATAAGTALNGALADAGMSQSELAGIVSTGIFRDVLESPALHVTATVSEHMADARGALFLNQKARTVVDLGGNVHKIIRFDRAGNLADVAQNDKCADGLGIFLSTAAHSLGLSEPELSELALGSTGSHAIAIQCSLSAQTDATDLVCQGIAAADVARAALGYVVERVASLCRSMPLAEEVVVAGGLAQSAALVGQLRTALGVHLSLPERPQYVGAIGAAVRGQP